MRKPALDSVLGYLERTFAPQVRAHQVLPPEPAQTAPFPPGLHPVLREVLAGQGIPALYTHQAAAFESIAAGRDTLLVSRTASGKTLSFLLPVLSEYLNSDPPFSVLMLYPTKALSRDQEGTLGRLMEAAIRERRMGTFDGDTPQEERRHIQRTADFVITNPDMLHAGILPNHHRGWKTFLARLRYIIVDEVHTYRGAFGSHVANVFRRLLRVCEMHGSRPIFIGSSATVGNPGEQAEALFRRPVTVITGDGSPRPARDLYLMNPPLVKGLGESWYRKGPASMAIPLIRHAAEAGVRTICFCRARQEVERLRRAVVDRHPGLESKVQPYRGGLLPSERRRLERELFEGRLPVIISTNALELGIDIGDLDLCILCGHAGAVASFWQQAGRVGRRGARAGIVYIARDAPVDQYLVNHPDFILGAPVEQAWLNADNPYIFLQHLPCAAHEHPLRPEEPLFTERVYAPAVRALEADGTVKPYHGCHRYARSDYPARGVNLRGMTDYNVEIYCGSEVIGEIDPIGARGTLYKDAIYQHLGRRYLSLDLDLAKKLCKVEEVNVDYYTEAVWENRVEMTEVETEARPHEAEVAYGYVHVNKQPKLFKKIRERTHENVGYGPITLDAFEYDTTGFSLLPSDAWKRAMDAADRRYLPAALYGLSYLLRRAAPALAMADTADVDTDVSLHEEEEKRWRSALYLYDAIEGGVGYAEKIFEKLPEALAFCRRIIESCECAAGCPSCVPPLPPGVTDEELELFLVESDASVECTRSLLDALLEGVVRVPEITERREPRPPSPEPPPGDVEAEKLARRLQKASEILGRKRAREH